MRLPRRFLHPLCLGALALALALLAWDTSLQLRMVERITSLGAAWTNPPAEDPKSPTGYELGRRNLVLPYEGTDGYHWIMQTQQMFAEGQPRVRQVAYDNAPDGREVHWASPLRWWMGATARLHHAFSGRSLPVSVERSAPYANPLLLAVALLFLTPVVAQRFGPAAGAIFALGSVGMGPYAWFFSAPIPDHHGLATLCGLLCVLFLVAGGGGWLRQPAMLPPERDPLTNWLPEARQARGWFIASGIAGGIGLWISAASQALVLIGIGCAAILVGWMAKPAQAKLVATAYEPKLWRIWGLAGAATSLAAYLIEYFPSGSGWRLEVNHPLFALAWAGAGELLHAWCRRRARGRWTDSPRDSALLMLAAFAVSVLPVVVILTYEDTFWVADPFLFRLHKNYIQEFQPLLASLGSRIGPSLVLLCLPLLAFPLAGFLAKHRQASTVLRSLLVLAFAPAAILLLFALKQSRWFGVSYGLLLSGFVFLVCICCELGVFKRLRVWVPLFLLACALSAPTRTLLTQLGGEITTQEDVYQLALRDLAYWLRARTGAEPCVVASAPTLSTFFVFHGGVQGVGTFYWENLHGLRATADLFAAKTEEEAYRIVRERGITHIVMVSWDDFLTEYIRLVRGIPKGEAVPDNAIFLQLIKTKILPPWLRLAPYRFPADKTLEDQLVFVFEVVPPQPPEAPLANLANFLLDVGEARSALRFAPALERNRAYFPTLIALGRVCLKKNDPGPLATVMTEIKDRLAEADSLSLEDHLQLGCLLAFTGDTVAASEQLTHCAARMSEHDVRRLSASAAYNFLYLAPRLGVPSPSQSMVELAFDLLPPKAREQLRSSVGLAAP
jgi:hypothetical protein